MKKLTLLLFISFFTNINNAQYRGGLASSKNIKGAVKSIRQIPYYAEKKLGKIIKGNLIEYKEFSENEMRIYNKNGNIIEFITYYSDGSFFGKRTYLYDEKGNKLELKGYFSDGILGYRRTYLYNENGNLIEEKSYDGAMNFEGREVNKHDKNGNVIEKYRYYYDGSLRTSDFYQYLYDEKGNIIEKIFYDSKYTYLYDEKGNIIERSLYNDGTFFDKNSYLYDVEGNEIEDNYSNSNGSLQYTSSFQYKYDEQGNWIEKIFFSSDGNPVTITERRIIYYDDYTQSLKQQLWEFASKCHEMISQGYEDAFDKKPEKLEDYCYDCVDDSSNGFLYISGSWPTCGCSCYNEIGAYQNIDGSYTLLRYESWPCENSFGIYSNKNIVDVLPKNLSLKTFNPLVQIDTLSYFYLDMRTLSVGTDTKAVLRLFPLGQVGIEKRGISYDTEKSKVLYSSLYSIQKIAECLQSDSQLQSIMNKKISDLPKSIKNKILSYIGENREFKSEKELITKLLYLKKVYDIYISLQFTEMTFSWNRKLERFEIKDMAGKPKKISFLKFIKESWYFSYAC